jgi:two-component system, chemotaxis family, CheB/CheR fusion protein
VRSDPLLLEQMMRNLLSNAMKYTKRGKVLLGCRRRGDRLSIEVWDTGIGIPAKELVAIFEEYHQVDNPARERSRGLGLGLSIVQRLGDLLGHRIRVRSNPTKGSAFTIDVPVSSVAAAAAIRDRRSEWSWTRKREQQRTGTILIVEDDPDIRDLLELLLAEEGHHAMTAPDAKTALDLVARGRIGPTSSSPTTTCPPARMGFRSRLDCEPCCDGPCPRSS